MAGGTGRGSVAGGGAGVTTGGVTIRWGKGAVRNERSTGTAAAGGTERMPADGAITDGATRTPAGGSTLRPSSIRIESRVLPASGMGGNPRTGGAMGAAARLGDGAGAAGIAPVRVTGAPGALVTARTRLAGGAGGIGTRGV